MKTEDKKKRFNIDIENLKCNEQLVCDHRVREPNGLVYTFRNVCELCGKDMRAN